MSLDVGSVVVDLDGTVTKSGLAAVFYDEIEAQETAVMVVYKEEQILKEKAGYPDRENPPATFTGTPTTWTSRIDVAITNLKRLWARQANAMAKAVSYGAAIEGQTPDTTTPLTLNYPIPNNCLGLFEVTIQGVRAGVAPSTARMNSRYTVSASRHAGGNGTYHVNSGHTDNAGAGEVQFSAGAGNLITQVFGAVLATVVNWRIQVRPIQLFVYPSA